MAQHLRDLQAVATESLAAGERICGAALVGYGGKVNLSQPTQGLAVMGHHETQVAAGESMVERYGERPDVHFPSARQMAIVLTDRRLLIWSRGLSGKPKAFIGEVPLGVVASATCEARPGAQRLQLGLSSGWEVQLDVTAEEGEFVAGLVGAVPDSA
jgi:hypothetical protein